MVQGQMKQIYDDQCIYSDSHWFALILRIIIIFPLSQIHWIDHTAVLADSNKNVFSRPKNTGSYTHCQSIFVTEILVKKTNEKAPLGANSMSSHIPPPSTTTHKVSPPSTTTHKVSPPSTTTHKVSILQTPVEKEISSFGQWLCCYLYQSCRKFDEMDRSTEKIFPLFWPIYQIGGVGGG